MKRAYLAAIPGLAKSSTSATVSTRGAGDGKYILMSLQKIERNQDNPDGRSYICTPPPNDLYPADTAFCFSLEGST